LASQINASNSGFGGIVSTGDSSGVLQLQAAGTTIATIQSTGLNLGSNGVVFSDSSTQTAAASPYVLKNRIINGDMRIDQRNAGSSTTPSTDTYTVDRWKYETSIASKFTIQQNKGSVTPPSGFTNYLGFTTSTAYSVGAGDYFFCEQYIEGFNTADLAWGTASAKTVTLSFWVYSSLTGTFAGNLQNGANARFYPFSYTISSANTWEQKTITITGDTSGTWATGNTAGILLRFNLGMGSTYLGTAGSWTSSTILGVTGQTNIVGTLNANWYITGVQLEQNTSATPFERRLYNQELANCQRYFQPVLSATGAASGSTAVNLSVSYTSMRTDTPTFTTPSGYITITDWYATNTNTSSPPTWTINVQIGNNSNIRTTNISGLTTARPYGLSGGTGYIYAQAEL
jgi:hypothetical protein